MKSWLLILGVWALALLYWRQNGMAQDLRPVREFFHHITR